MQCRKGKLIVIDGSDGSGKATQTKLAVRALQKNEKKVRTIDFPQYEQNFMGGFVGECLKGAHGDFLSLDPKIASVIYAMDRFESSQKIEKWLNEGYTVITDRYVSANQIHQGGKIADARKRAKFLAWLDDLEYGVCKLPRPTLVIYLDVSIQISQGLLAADGKKLDLAENDQLYLENSRKSALWLSKREQNWQRVSCVHRGCLKNIDAIHHEIMEMINHN